MKMHSMAGIHSALAIKRQRRNREKAARERARKMSTISSDSGDTFHGSTRRKFNHASGSHGATMLDTKVVTSIGMLHIGVVFLVFGMFILGAGLLPTDLSGMEKTQLWNELVATGIFAIILGVFLLVLNCLISKHEENDLEAYVQRQLTRSRSGHRLERDVETGGLITRHNRRFKQTLENEDNVSQTKSNHTPITSEVVTPTTPNDVVTSGEMLLDQILEEDSVYSEDRSHEVLSPHGHEHLHENDKKYLLGNGHMTNIKDDF